MFWRKTRQTIAGFHPLHQQLVHDRAFGAAMPPAEWAKLVTSVAGHDAALPKAKWALPSRFHEVVVPLLRAVAADVGPGATLRLAVDLRGPEAPGKSGPPRPVSLSGRVLSASESTALDPWLRLEADLRDGGTLSLTVTDRVRTRKVTKRSRSGKTKRKSKLKSSQQISVRRTLPKGVAGVQPRTPPPRGITTRVARRNRTTIRADVKLSTVPLPGAQLPMLLGVLAEPFRWTPPTATRSTA